LKSGYDTIQSMYVIRLDFLPINDNLTEKLFSIKYIYMSQDKKKIFPKFQKKLKWFLTDESWKITKKNALWLAAWAALLSSVSWVNNTAAWHGAHWNAMTPYNSTSSHGNYCQVYPCAPILPTNDWCQPSNSSNWTAKCQDAYCSYPWNMAPAHSSWLVNGHYSWQPVMVWSIDVPHHSSHASHWSHWSHASHWSHWSHWSW